MIRVLLSVLLAVALIAPSARAADDAPSGARKKIFLLAGGPSHGFGAHDHLSGCHLLAKRLNDANLGIEAVVIQGFPKEKGALDGAAAVIMYCDGGGGHMALTKTKELNALHEQGAGIGCIHYAVEVPKGKPGENWIKWMGGYFETHWSINPHWTAKFEKLPEHAVTKGVKPFETNDEWYYNMRFREGMKDVTPILSAVPPDSTRKRGDGPHSGNPHVTAGIGKNQPEHVMWVSENEGGGRGFGFTGGHRHWNWKNDDQRKLMLNAICWIAKIDVPADGVPSKTPTQEEMEANLKPKPAPKEKK